MKVLVAPDSFKGTYGAEQVARELAAGLAAGGAQADLCPVADGGEGTAAIVGPALGCERHEAAVSDAFGRPVTAAYYADGERAFLDLAEASGIGGLSPGELDPIRATTAGTGELVLAALATGAATVTIAAGGSATVDGGTGAAEAIRAGGGIGSARLVVLCDVNTSFEEAAVVFGPQKGANASQVEDLTVRLNEQAAGMPRDPRGRPMTGAAGGFSGGMWAEFGAELVPGASFVLDLLDFDRRLAEADAVICGEGRIDFQSLQGKIPGEIATRARDAGVPAFAVVGRSDLSPADARRLGLRDIYEAGDPARMREAAQRIAEVLSGQRS